MPSASTPTGYSSTTLVKATASVLVLGVADDKVLGLETAKSARTALEDVARAIEFSGKAGSTARVAAPKGFSATSILLVGLGDFDATARGTDAAAKSHEVLRRAAGNALRAVDGVDSIAVGLPALSAEAIEAVTVGAALGAYRFIDYRSEDSDKVPGTVTSSGPRARSTRPRTPPARSSPQRRTGPETSSTPLPSISTPNPSPSASRTRARNASSR
ncbi:MAG: hypothetical protein L0G72_08655 [Brevibacterium aurantiacum]|nr:hypothetical protein [Brevibacterium aurantiacum]